MPSIETYELVLAAVAACEDKKAEDIRVMALDPAESGLSDYFLICNGTNDRQNVAITDEIEIRLKRDFGIYPNSVEGRRQGEWILMDYVDFIVHVFSAEKRQYYGLERLRKSATTVSPDDLNAELKAEIRASRKKKAEAPAASKPAARAATIPAAKKKPATKVAGAKVATAKVPAKKAAAAKTVPAKVPAVKAAGKTAVAKKTAGSKAATPAKAVPAKAPAAKKPASKVASKAAGSKKTKK